MGKLQRSRFPSSDGFTTKAASALSLENDDLSTYYRLVKAGYVEVQLPDRFNPAVVKFKLTESGQGELEAEEGHQPFRVSRARTSRPAAADGVTL